MLLKLETGLKAGFGEGVGLFAVSVFAPAMSSLCCRNFTKLLLGFCCVLGTLGGVELLFSPVPPPLSSFTQLGLEAATTEGFGKAGLDSDKVELRGRLLKGGFCVGPLASAVCKRDDFKGTCCLKAVIGLAVLVSSWAFAILLANNLILFGSCASVSLLEDGVFFRNDGFVGVFTALPERLSKTGFFCRAGPERVGCRAGLGRPAGVEEVSSMLAPPVWKRAMMALTSALFS